MRSSKWSPNFGASVLRIIESVLGPCAHPLGGQRGRSDEQTADQLGVDTTTTLAIRPDRSSVSVARASIPEPLRTTSFNFKRAEPTPALLKRSEQVEHGVHLATTDANDHTSVSSRGSGLSCRVAVAWPKPTGVSHLGGSDRL
jgi:hypothetical protein